MQLYESVKNFIKKVNYVKNLLLTLLPTLKFMEQLIKR